MASGVSVNGAIPAVFLDRDGVINEVIFRDGQPCAPRTIEEFRFCDGVEEPLRRLAAAGARLFVVTNQPEVARGLIATTTIDAMTRAIVRVLPVEEVLVCPHDDADRCVCRKPRAGMLRDVAERGGVELARAVIVGDTWKDIAAGREAGCTTILLRRDYNRSVAADHVVRTLGEAADVILRGDMTDASSYVAAFLDETRQITERLSREDIARLARGLAALRASGGRLFVLGVGGSAANASHAAGDFRKLAGLEAYAPTDNVAELTARVNDEGWDTVFVAWLRGSRLTGNDAVLVLSVGGGDPSRGISGNLAAAVDYARSAGARVFGIVGRDGGHTARVADACIVIPTVNAARVTPHTEVFQAVVWHLLVSHPELRVNDTKWESVQP